MRLRTDSSHIAGWKRAHELRGCSCTPEMLAASRVHVSKRATGSTSHVAHDRAYRKIEAAQAGDVWILHNANDGITGYALTCPKADCDQGVHHWDHARDCALRTAPDAPPCWAWSGSVEDDTLTASPSLHSVLEWGGCGWHGWLQSGQMSPAS